MVRTVLCMRLVIAKVRRDDLEKTNSACAGKILSLDGERVIAGEVLGLGCQYALPSQLSLYMVGDFCKVPRETGAERGLLSGDCWSSNQRCYFIPGFVESLRHPGL